MENLILQILEGKNMNLVSRVETCYFLEWEDKHSEGFKILRFWARKDLTLAEN